MDEMTAFERQIGRVLGRMGGPTPTFDAAAIARRAAEATPVGAWPAFTRRVRGSSSLPRERSFTMFSALKLAVAGAVVALFSGVLLVAVVGEPRETLLPPAADSPPPSAEAAGVPTRFSGSFACSTYWQDGHQRNVVLATLEEGALVRRETRGELGRFTAEVSDARLQGDWTMYAAADEYLWPGVDAQQPLILAPGVMRVTNAQGWWQMPWGYVALPGEMPDHAAFPAGAEGGLAYLEGGGGYDGLTALFRLQRSGQGACHCFESKGYTADSERCAWQVEGFIVEGTMPTPEVSR